MLRGILRFPALFWAGLVLALVGQLCVCVGPRVEVKNLDLTQPKSWVDAVHRRQVARPVAEGFVLGRGLGRAAPDGHFEAAALATEATTPRKEAIWFSDRVDQRAEARFVAEARERALADRWNRIGGAIRLVGVILMLLALGLVAEGADRRSRALERGTGLVAGSQGVSSHHASSLTAQSMGLTGDPPPRRMPRPRPVIQPDAVNETAPAPADPTTERTVPDEATSGWRIIAERTVPGGATERVVAEGDGRTEGAATVGPRVEVRVTSRTPEPGADTGGETPTAAS